MMTTQRGLEKRERVNDGKMIGMLKSTGEGVKGGCGGSAISLSGRQEKIGVLQELD